MNAQQYAFITEPGTMVPVIMSGAGGGVPDGVQGAGGQGNGQGGEVLGEVAEILRPVPGFTLARCFPEEVTAACVPCGEEVQPGWTYDGAAFAPPSGPPEPTEEERKALRLAQIEARLAEIDRESIRPLRAVADGSATDYDRQKLTALEEEAKTLREERKELEANE